MDLTWRAVRSGSLSFACSRLRWLQVRVQSPPEFVLTTVCVFFFALGRGSCQLWFLLCSQTVVPSAHTSYDMTNAWLKKDILESLASHLLLVCA